MQRQQIANIHLFPHIIIWVSFCGSTTLFIIFTIIIFARSIEQSILEIQTSVHSYDTLYKVNWI